MSAYRTPAKKEWPKCPYCFHDKIITKPAMDSGKSKVLVWCCSCMAEGPWCDTVEEALEIWRNTKVVSHVPKKPCVQCWVLQAKLDEIHGRKFLT